MQTRCKGPDGSRGLLLMVSAFAFLDERKCNEQHLKNQYVAFHSEEANHRNDAYVCPVV